MRRLLLLLSCLVTVPASAALQSSESALSENWRAGRLDVGRLPDAAATPRARAALGARAVMLGAENEARRLFGSLETAARDCALQARLAELEAGEACPELSPTRLDEAELEPPAAFAVVAAEPGVSGSGFPAAVMVRCLKALVEEGGVRIESTGDRFRVSGSSALEGLWYLDDRVLVAARPAAGRPAAEAIAALERMLGPAPAPSDPEPPAPSGEPATDASAPSTASAHGWTLAMPHDWLRTGEPKNAWVPPGAARGPTFPPPGGAFAIVPALSAEPGGRRRNPLARRAVATEAAARDAAALPAQAIVIVSREEAGGLRAVEWRPGRGRPAREALVRVVRTEGRPVLLVAHLGDALGREAALAALRDAAPDAP